MARINWQQVEMIAQFLRDHSGLPRGLNFYNFIIDGKETIDDQGYPSLYHPQAINFSFFWELHNYGFWYGNENGYIDGQRGTINGKRATGSTLLSRALIRALRKNEMCLTPQNLANISPVELFYEILCDDNGPIPYPNLETRLIRTQQYGRWFIDNDLTPQDIVNTANLHERPLSRFIAETKLIPGFDKDQFLKRNMLLAMSLYRRPEQFLQVIDHENWRPIIDYQLIRLALRQGMVELDQKEAAHNQHHAWISAEEEEHIRRLVYDVFVVLIQKSGKTMFAIDELYWKGGRYCPELKAVNCAECIFNSVCDKRIDLFQPVFRTTAY